MSKAAETKKKVNKAGDYSYLKKCLDYLKIVVESRLQSHYEGNEVIPIDSPKPGRNDHSPLATFYNHYSPSHAEMITLMVALVPNVMPGFFDNLIHRYLPGGGDFAEFGGVKGLNHRGTLPTAETVLFILAGTDPEKRLAYYSLFDDNSFLIKHKVLSIQPAGQNEPPLSGRIHLEKEFIEVFTTGKVGLPKLTTDFPAEYISTEMEWEDLVLKDHTMEQIREIEQWIQHNETLMENWGMHKKLKPGYRALFYGPPGTGKTLTATLLGKYTGRHVFRIDLSMVVSKYIGETEKNLASLFERAEHKNWILFFDEADAIFGKRTGVRDAHDKYANQEVSYLLQRIESHSGLSILASNFKNNIDQAFIRRFNAIIYFPNPEYDEKYKLWQNAFPKEAPLTSDISFEYFSAQYDLTGAQIMNVVQYTCLQSLSNKKKKIGTQELEKGVKRELAKEGK